MSANEKERLKVIAKGIAATIALLTPVAGYGYINFAAARNILAQALAKAEALAKEA